MTENNREIAASIAAGAARLCRRAWWVFLIGGLASVIFGVLAFANPGIALLVLATFFAAFILVDGAVNVWGALQNRDKDGWIALLLFGALGVCFGGYALAVPPLSMIALIYVIAFFALANGLTTIFLGWKVRQEITTEWVLYVSGALSVLFALLILFRPAAGGIAVAYMVGTWAIIVGLLRIYFAFFVRKLRHIDDT
jgi:uncharacterized membrane protein HdeD (DUF308 family)